MSKGGFSVVIAAQDKASKRLAEINKRLAGISAPTQRLNKEFGKLAHSTGLRGVRTILKDTSRYAERLASASGRFAAPFAALTGGAGLAGIAGLSRQYADFGSNLDIAARRAGMSVSHLMRLRNASYLAGGSMEAANAAAEGLGRNIALVHAGQGNQTFMAGLRQLGIKNWGRQSAGQLMPEILQKLAGIRNPQQQQYFGEAILGGSFSQLQPMLMEGVRGLRQYMAASQQAGLLTKKQAEAARTLQFQERRLEMSVVGLGNSIMADLVPGINSASGGMAGWLDQNRKWLASDISQKIHEVGGAIHTVVTDLGGWKSAGGDLLEWYSARFFPGMIGGFMRLDALMRAGGQFAKSRGWTDRDWMTGKKLPSALPVHPHLGLRVRSLGEIEAWFRHSPVGLPASSLDRRRQALRYFEQQGYTPAQAAGIVANIQAESSYRTAPPQTAFNKGHYGIAQWDERRREQIRRATGIDVAHATYQQQLQAMQWELTHTQSGVGKALRGASGASAAAMIFRNRYERPGYDPIDQLRRMLIADRIYGQNPNPIPAHLAARPGGAGVKASPNGKATLHIKFSNPPPGLSSSSLVEGDLWDGAPKVTTSMPPGGVP